MSTFNNWFLALEGEEELCLEVGKDIVFYHSYYGILEGKIIEIRNDLEMIFVLTEVGKLLIEWDAIL